jgi:Uma2 family endonuclease
MVATHQLQRPYTAADLAAMPDDGRKYEVIGGELIVAPSPAERHQYISGRLFRRVQAYVEDNDIGVAYAAAFDVHLSEHDIVQPDILVVLKANVSRLREVGMAGPPDLAVEIISPSSAGIDRVRKAAAYATFGVPEYWIVDPDSETILAQTSEGRRFRPMTSDDGLIHSAQIAGLVIDPTEVFAVPDWMPRIRARRGDA